jgi:hypothetical protein
VLNGEQTVAPFILDDVVALSENHVERKLKCVGEGTDPVQFWKVAKVALMAQSWASGDKPLAKNEKWNELIVPAFLSMLGDQITTQDELVQLLQILSDQILGCSISDGLDKMNHGTTLLNIHKPLLHRAAFHVKCTEEVCLAALRAKETKENMARVLQLYWMLMYKRLTE